MEVAGGVERESQLPGLPSGGVEREIQLPAQQQSLPVGSPGAFQTHQDGIIAELAEEQGYPAVTAPVEITAGKLALFHYDAGLHASCAAASDRHCR